jgi:ATP adenylyltransferase
VQQGAHRPASDDFIRDVDQSTDDRTHLVVCRTDLSIVILNRYPYNNGHLLIAPRRAVAELEEMTDAELLDCQKTIVRMIAAMRTVLKPDGFNVGLNLGRSAGAGLPGHLHWHLVPRWNGDTNFMTVVGDARVISQSLDEFWLQIRRALDVDPS